MLQCLCTLWSIHSMLPQVLLTCATCQYVGGTNIEAMDIRLFQTLQQLAGHLHHQLPWQLPELLFRLQHQKAPEDIRAFGLSWAQEVLNASDHTASNTIFGTVLAVFTSDSSPKMRSNAAKSLLGLVPTCSKAVQAHAAQLAAAACLGLADTSQDVTKDCERLLSAVAPHLASSGHQGTAARAASPIAASWPMPLVPHGAQSQTNADTAGRLHANLSRAL